MKIGAFEITEPVPELKDPHAFAMIRPWVDVGSVGTLTLSRLERFLGSKELGKLARPGNFFDFTRYRPTTFAWSRVNEESPFPTATSGMPARKRAPTTSFST